MHVLILPHVVFSLVGIFSGFVVAYGFLTVRRLNTWNTIFLVTTIATSATNLVLPIGGRFVPLHVLAILSLLVLRVAWHARYGEKLARGWQSTYVITALFAQYLNVLVLVVQLFRKVPGLKVLSPSLTGVALLDAQLLTLAGFIVLGALSVVRYRPSIHPEIRGRVLIVIPSHAEMQSHPAEHSSSACPRITISQHPDKS